MMMKSIDRLNAFRGKDVPLFCLALHLSVKSGLIQVVVRGTKNLGPPSVSLFNVLSFTLDCCDFPVKIASFVRLFDFHEIGQQCDVKRMMIIIGGVSKISPQKKEKSRKEEKLNLVCPTSCGNFLPIE